MQADDKNTVPSGLNYQLSTKSDEFYLERMKEILAVNSSARPPSAPVEMAENVFMGSQKHAEDFKLLRRYGITHIVNCAGSKLVNCAQNQDQRVSNTLYPEESGISECLIIGAVDHEDYDIGTHFDKAIDFLNSVEKKGGRTLVHCNLGVNRSGAVMAAYLMVRKKMSLLSVIDYIKQKRSVALSNRGFRKQLISFAKKRGLLESSEIKKTSKETAVNSSSDIDEGRSPQTPVVRFQSYDQWINCEDLDSKVIMSENDSKISSLKNRVQAAVKPKISDRFWSFSRSFVKWRSKTHGRRNERNSESAVTSPIFGQLDPVYEHSETGENAQIKSSEECIQQAPHPNNQQFDRPSSAQRSNSFLSLLKIPGRRMKSSSISDFHSLHQSTSSASFIEVDPSISSSAMRPLRISQSVGNNITSC